MIIIDDLLSANLIWFWSIWLFQLSGFKYLATVGMEHAFNVLTGIMLIIYQTLIQSVIFLSWNFTDENERNSIIIIISISIQYIFTLYSLVFSIVFVFTESINSFDSKISTHKYPSTWENINFGILLLYLENNNNNKEKRKQPYIRMYP